VIPCDVCRHDIYPRLPSTAGAFCLSHWWKILEAPVQESGASQEAHHADAATTLPHPSDGAPRPRRVVSGLPRRERRAEVLAREGGSGARERRPAPAGAT
jgi:hypothetical protein